MRYLFAGAMLGVAVRIIAPDMSLWLRSVVVGLIAAAIIAVADDR